MRVRSSITLGVISFLFILFGCVTGGTQSTKPGHSPGTEGHFSGDGVTYIDAHNHLQGRFKSHFGSPELDYEGAARVVLEKMNRMGIRRMIIMPPPFSPDHPNKYTFQDLLGVVKRYPDRFAVLGGGGTLNIMIHQAVHEGRTSQEVKRSFEKKAMEIISQGAVGFGEMAAEHLSLNYKHPHEYAPPDHPLFLLLADIAAHHHMPIDIHMEAVPEDMPLPKIKRLNFPNNPKILKANIAAFERLLAHNRNASQTYLKFASTLNQR